MRVWIASLLLFFAAAGTLAAIAETDVCRSRGFREAFLEGQSPFASCAEGVRPSPLLVERGDSVVPCLSAIARDGGAVFGIEGCLEITEGCRTWALSALRLIGTPAARVALRAHATGGDNPRLRQLSIQALGSLRDTASRPLFREALKTGEPSVRAEAIVALGLQRRVEDREVLLQAFQDLPDEDLYRALHGLRVFEDPTLLRPARGRIELVEDPKNRASLERSLEAWNRGVEQERVHLSAIETQADPDSLFLALQGVQRPSRAVAVAAERRLVHADARVRAGAVALLARAEERPTGLDELLRVADGLPDEYVAIAARGLLRIPDPSVAKRLSSRAERIENAFRRAELERLIAQFEAPHEVH